MRKSWTAPPSKAVRQLPPCHSYSIRKNVSAAERRRVPTDLGLLTGSLSPSIMHPWLLLPSYCISSRFPPFALYSPASRTHAGRGHRPKQIAARIRIRKTKKGAVHLRHKIAAARQGVHRNVFVIAFRKENQLRACFRCVLLEFPPAPTLKRKLCVEIFVFYVYTTSIVSRLTHGGN